MTDFNINMTFGDQWRAIKAGDVGVIIASLIEMAIAIVPFVVLYLAFTQGQ